MYLPHGSGVDGELARRIGLGPHGLDVVALLGHDGAGGAGEGLLDQLPQQHWLAAHQLVHGVDVHAGPPGDVGDRGPAVAPLDHELAGGVDDALAGLLRLGLATGAVVGPTLDFLGHADILTSE